MIWLQHFAGWDKWEEKLENTSCSDRTPYVQTASDSWEGGVLSAQGLRVKSFHCVSAMAFTKTLIPVLVSKRYYYIVLNGSLCAHLNSYSFVL